MGKGISNLVETVLMILITLAAVGIITWAVMPLIKGGIGNAQKCNEAGITINSDYTYYNSTTTILALTLAKGPKDVQIDKIQIKLRDASGASNISEQTTVPGINSDTNYLINTTALGIGSPVSIGIAPVINTGKAEYMCQMSEAQI